MKALHCLPSDTAYHRRPPKSSAALLCGPQILHNMDLDDQWNLKKPYFTVSLHGVFILQGNDESCLSILNNFYNDGIKWHDVACHHLKPFVCEDSDELLNFVRSRNPGIRL